MKCEVNETISHRNVKCIVVAAIITIFIFFSIIFSVGKGAMDIRFLDTWNILIAKITGNTEKIKLYKENAVAVIWDIRLPRIICSIFVGMGLSIAGTIFQSLLINPLADPYTLGVSTGAAFGASLAILLNITMGMMLSTTICAFISAFLTLLLVIFIAKRGDGMLSSGLIVSGIIVSSILSSGISFIKMMAGENVGAIVFWLMGSLSSKQWTDVALIVPIVTVTGIIAFIFANDLNVMTMGENTAKALGVKTKRIRLLYLIIGSCITAACVAVSGIIGFIGLVVPHILRFWLTPDNRMLVPLSALLGGLLLTVADNTTRLMFVSEIPVGVITTLLGGPFFIYIFTVRKRNGVQ